MKLKSICIIVAALAIHLQSMSQEAKKFIGTWEGKLNVGVELKIIVHIKADADGNISSTLDSPDQSAFGIATDKPTVNGNQFGFEVNRLNARYTGKLINDSTIDGTFSQGGPLPLVLSRKKEEVVHSPNQMPDQTLIHDLAYKNIDVSVHVKNITLSGTLFQPLKNKKSPVVLVIAGSGPTDRDGNSRLLPGKNNSLLQIADSLAQYGIATLRYDKRGIGKSKPDSIMKEEDITIDNIADDATAMYEWLKTQGYNDIYIAGHSEGSLIGMMTATKVNPKGFISLAGAGRKIRDILGEQLSGQLSAELYSEFNNDLDSLEQGLSVTAPNPSLMSLLRPSVQPYIKSWLRLDPQKLIAQLKCPVLIIQGSKDIQVNVRDAEYLHSAKPASKISIITNMNHLFKEVISDNRNDNLKTYSDPSLPVMTQLISTIVDFIKQAEN